MRQAPGILSGSPAVALFPVFATPVWCRLLHAALQFCCAWLLHEEAHPSLAECRSHCCLLHNVQHGGGSCFQVSILRTCLCTNVRKLFPKAPLFLVMMSAAQVSLWQAMYLILEMNMLGLDTMSCFKLTNVFQ